VLIGGPLGELLRFRRVALALVRQRHGVEHIGVLLVRLPQVVERPVEVLFLERDHPGELMA
jgi:hypothetical protein